MTALAPNPGFDWLNIAWGAPDEPRTEHCSYCGDALDPEGVPLILSRPDGWVAEFCDHCQAVWWGIETFAEPAPDDPGDAPDLGPCCLCERRPATTIVMLDRRCAMPGHGWGCVVCGLPPDGASAVLCPACADIYETDPDPSRLKTACRGYPASDGRIPLAELTEPFEHDDERHFAEERR